MRNEPRNENVREPETQVEKLAQSMFGCTLENYRSLKERVAKADGKVLLLIHPFFEQDNKLDIPTVGARADRMRDMMKEVENRIASLRESEIPLLVLQEEKNMPLREMYLIGDPRQNIFFVPTLERNSQPSFHVAPGRLGGWEEMMEVLTDMQVKNIELGGMYFWDKSSYILNNYDGCVGSAYNTLKAKFPVEVTRMTYPDVV
jgi:hypothetical protein